MKFKLAVFLSLITSVLFSQNIEKIGKRDALKVNGGFNFNSIFYDSKGLAARRDPFTWFFSGNLNFSVLDWNIPFNYSYSNQQGTFTQPFNQYGIMPQYKWFKGYAGYNSMSFSPYTLAGHVFLGGGAEFTPGNWKMAVMYGRLKKAVAYDVLNESDANMSYQRMGYGVRAGYEKSGYGLFVNFFHAEDDITSLKFIPVNSTVMPMENTVASLQGKARIGSRFFCEAEYALSGLTRSLFAEKDESAKNYFPGLFTTRSGSQFFDAVKSSFGYQMKRFNVSLNYERVAPDYQTLGAYYFNNDLENITLAPSFRLLKDKLNISVNAGVQRNNLDNNKLSSVKRVVGATNVSFAPNRKLNMTAAYSNFTTYTRLRPQNDPYFTNTIDSLNFYQLSQSANASVNYSMGRSDKLKQSIVLTGAYQVTGDKTGEQANVPATVINGNLGYSLGWIPAKTTGVIAVNINQSKFGDNTTLYAGPNLSVSRSFYKNKLRSSIGTSYNDVLSNNKHISAVMNNRLSLNYTPAIKNKKYGKPSISMNAVHLHRFNVQPTASKFDEFTVTVNLSYGF